jgi:8-oxo-dGTP pyrophosphatase MutT (NUDIX family)
LKPASESARYPSSLIRAVLMPEPSPQEFEPLWPAKIPSQVTPSLKSWLPQRRRPAAVLVPVIQREAGLNILLTQRAANLREHAGQVSFPGGRIESHDQSPWHAALRESQEEIGLDPATIEFAGYLPDHLVGTGFRVTPVVGFVKAPVRLALAYEEVEEVFEVPLDHLFDVANQSLRKRRFGETEVHFHDIRYQHRSIWGATAGMLMTWQRLIDAHRETSP